MKQTLHHTILILFLCQLICAQTTATIKNKTTNEPVPYVNIFIEGESTGTSANEEGFFTLPSAGLDKTLVLSAIGYETAKIPARNLTNTILLTPAAIQLHEVVINCKKEKLELKTGSFKNRDIIHYFGCGVLPWMIGRFFPYDTTYAKTPYLQLIKINTNSDVKTAIMNIRLYLPDENGKPGKALHNENILFSVKKGDRITEVNLAPLNITFPEQGLFVVTEWFIIEQNKYVYRYTEHDTGKVHKDGISYEPAIGAISDATGTNSWRYSGGNWTNTFKRYDINRKDKGDHLLMAAELTLSN